MKSEQLNELVYEALETELGGVKVYELASSCAVNPDLKEEWSEYLKQTKRHVEIVRELCEALSLDPAEETHGRRTVRHSADCLLEAMRLAKQGGDPAAAEIVAAESVVTAETKDHQN